MRNHCYENDFDLHENETACRPHFHMKCFALRLVLKQRHKRTRKWPIDFTRKNETIVHILTRYIEHHPFVMRSKRLSSSNILSEKKNFILFQFYTVKFVRIIFVNMFLQIISITPCELAFNSLETHGLHVHTRMLI